MSHSFSDILDFQYNMFRKRGHVHSMAVLRNSRAILMARLTITEKKTSDGDYQYTLFACTSGANTLHMGPHGHPQFGARMTSYDECKNRDPIYMAGITCNIGTECENEVDAYSIPLIPLFPNKKYNSFEEITWVVDPAPDPRDGDDFWAASTDPYWVGLDGSFGHNHVVIPAYKKIDMDAYTTLAQRKFR